MIVIFSSFLSPHMKPLCDELYYITNKQFLYVAVSKLSDERKKMGYEFAEHIPYLMDLTDNIQKQIEVANNADCVIINTGSANIDIVKQRISDNKVTFYMNERIFKRGILKLADPKMWRLLYFNLKYFNYNTYLLCLGNSVCKDFEKIGFHKNHSFKFGYFPESTLMKNTTTLVNKKELKLLWVARMINWKRPIFAVKTVEKLNIKGIKCTLNMLGDGVMFEKVKKYVEKKNLSNYIKIEGNVSNYVVRERMRESDLLIFTSNKREGWGAVANEALSGGLPVVASDSIGCTGYLVKDGKNGVLFKTNSINDAVDKIENMLNQNYNSFCEAAIETMNVWNAKEAAKRFMMILDEIYKKGSSHTVFHDGPMSKA